jgi:aryl-alcohol dehydrogenase-like predicted oxidoreductase
MNGDNISKTSGTLIPSQLSLKRIGLGTVQFGVDYGITNAKGKVPQAEAKKILTHAATIGINMIDTACQYGNSESVIGTLNSDIYQFKIVTKTPVSNNPKIDSSFCNEVILKFQSSLSNLGINKAYGLLVHNASDILKPGSEKLIEALEMIRLSGNVEKIGVSIYDAHDIEAILKIFLPDIIQVPLNILDQRLIKSGSLYELKKRGIEVHSRSLFLQGILLENSNLLPNYFFPIRHCFQSIENFAKEQKLTQLELCLLFGLSVTEVDRLIIGIASFHEFLKLKASLAKIINYQAEDMAHLSISEEKYINPSLWP